MMFDSQPKLWNENTRRFDELAAARQILTALMSPSYAYICFPFMEQIDAVSLGLKDYDAVVKYPMWLRKVSERLDNDAYPGIREFVCDFRLILVNCLRYNGVQSRLGRFAEKLELLFEQKLQLLSPDIRAKTSLQACLGCGSAEQEIAESGLLRRRVSSRLFGSAETRQATPIRALMEELEHTQHPDSGGLASCLYDGLNQDQTLGFGIGSVQCPLPMTSENSYNLLLARLTLWQRKRHEEELIDSWINWWANSDGQRVVNTVLRKSPEFLEIFQMLWLMDPFLGLSDAITTATHFQDVAQGLRSDVDNMCSLLNYPSILSPSRNLTMSELEFGLAVAPQASLTLSACVSGLLNTVKERSIVSTALTALSNNPRASAMMTAEAIGVPEDDDDFAARCPINRRLQAPHVNTLNTLSVPPYKVWEQRLRNRVAQWYSLSLEKRLNVANRIDKRFGLPSAFFAVCGYDKSPLEEKCFHELPMYQQLHIILALISCLLNSSENMRSSLDSTADWTPTRPVIIGEDVFRGLSFFHFPKMLGSEPSTYTRIFQYAFPTSDPEELVHTHPPPRLPDQTVALPPPPISEVLEKIYLPGPAFRSPTWLGVSLARSVQRHLIDAIQAEMGRLQGRIAESAVIGKPGKKNTYSLTLRVARLASIIEPFIRPQPLKSSGKFKTIRRKEQSELALVRRDAANLVRLQINEPTLHLANFSFFNRVTCGSVPISLHSRQGGSRGKVLKTVDSTASLTDFSKLETDEDSQMAATPSAPGDTVSEGGADEPTLSVDNAVSDFEDENSNSSTPKRTVLADSFDCFGDPDPQPAPATIKLSRKSGSNAWSVTKALETPKLGSPFSSFSTTSTPSENQLNRVLTDHDENEMKELKNSELLDPSSICKQTNQSVFCNGKAFIEEKNVDEMITSNQCVPVELADHVKLVTNELPPKTLAPTQNVESTAHNFNTVVFDLASLCDFLEDLRNRVSIGEGLLKELQTSAMGEEPLASIVDRFKEQLGASLAKKIVADEYLAAALTSKPLNNVDKEEAGGSDDVTPMDIAAPKNKFGRKLGRKRRAPSLLLKRGRPKRHCLEITEPASGEKPEVPQESPFIGILRLHEEALEGLRGLLASASDLKNVAETVEQDRVASERLAGLRLRKDMEAWEAANKPKVKKKEIVPIIAQPDSPEGGTIARRKESYIASVSIPPSHTTPHPLPNTLLAHPIMSPPGYPKILPKLNHLQPRTPPLAASEKLSLPPYQPKNVPRLTPSSVSTITTPSINRSPIAPITAGIIASPPPRKIFRFYDTLFTEDAQPVRLDADGGLIYLTPESVPIGHRQLAKQMIERYRSITPLNHRQSASPSTSNKQ